MPRPCCLYALSWLTLVLVDSVAMAQPKQPRLDNHGDPLPDGALVRLGTVRFRSGASIQSMAFTTDGKQLVTADRITGVHVWDVATGKELRVLPCINKDHPQVEPSPFAFIGVSPGGTHVFEVNNQAVCSVREVATGAELFKIDKKHWQNLCLVQFSLDGKRLALMANGQHTVDVHDVGTGKLLQSIAGEPDGNYRPFVAFTPDGRSFAVPAPTILAILYDVAGGKRFRELGTVKNEDTYAAGTFSPDGKLLAVFGGHYQRLEVWDVAAGKRLASVFGQFNSTLLTFTPDSRWIITPVNGNKLGVWEAATGKLVRMITDTQGYVWCTAVSPDGKLLASNHGQVVQIWHLDTGKRLHDVAGHVGHYLFVQFARDGKSILTNSPGLVSDEPETAFFWDAATGKQLKDVGWEGGSWPRGAVSTDGRVWVRSVEGEKITVRETATQKVLLQVDEPGFLCTTLVLTPDGKALMTQLISSGPGGGVTRLQLWDVGSGRKLLESKSDSIHGFFSADGRELIVLQGREQNHQAACYEVATGRKMPRTALPVEWNYSAAYTPGGRLLAEATRAGPVKLRETATGQTIDNLATRGQRLYSLAFSPNGRLLAGGTLEGSILVWDVATGREVAYLKGHRNIVMSLSWAPDGKRLASGSWDLTGLVWDAQPWLTPTNFKLTAAESAALWRDLASDKVATAYRAVERLVLAPQATVALFKQQLVATAPAEHARLRALVEKLNDAKYTVRQQAQVELENLGDIALPILEKVLDDKSSLEVRLRVEKVLQKMTNALAPACLQQMRALAVLTMIGNAEALALLETLAAGDPEAWLTREARAAKVRLAEAKSP